MIFRYSFININTFTFKQDAANARIQGELQGEFSMSVDKKSRKTISEVESDLPEDIRDDALRVFRSAIADKCTIQDAINKVT